MTFEENLSAGLVAKADAAMRRQIAYHESAHALVGVLLGEVLMTVTMDGRATFEGDPDTREDILAHAKIALAGTVGEAVGIGGSHPLGPASDYPKALELLKRLGPDRPRVHDLALEVQQLVLDHEAALHRIAAALLSEAILNGARVKELIASEPP